MPVVRDLAFGTARAVPRYPHHAGGAAVAVLALAALSWHLGAEQTGPLVVLASAVIWAAVTGWWWIREVLPSQTSRGTVDRRSDRQQRAGGVASMLDLAQHASPAALRHRAGVLRPSLRGARRWQIEATDLGVQVAHTGIGGWGQTVWVSCEDTTLRIGGPRTGKTLSLACHGLDAPGALVTTSTRLDLAEMVHPARRSRPVHLFNPVGLGGLPSTVRWSVLVGCHDYATAARRAGDLIPESGSAEGERWDGHARRVLALLLHAAALAEASVGDIQRWLGDLGSDKTGPRALGEVVDALSVLPTSLARVSEVRQFWVTNDRTRTSVTAMIAPALSWMADDAVRHVGDAPAGTVTLDVARLITGRETLHILGHEDRTSIAPLTAALTAEIAHQARQIASTHPGGRLDPPLTMLLDEAALVCRVPLHKWTADFGGRNITLHISVQSLAQLRDRWGHDAASTILGNVGALVVFGGSRDAADLNAISTLTGEYRQRIVGGSRRPSRIPLPNGRTGRRDSVMDTARSAFQDYRWVPVMSPAQIGALPSGQVLVLRRGLDAVIGRAPLATGRRRWRQLPLTIEALTTTRTPLHAVPTVTQDTRREGTTGEHGAGAGPQDEVA